jgi:hypothetical protein
MMSGWTTDAFRIWPNSLLESLPLLSLPPCAPVIPVSFSLKKKKLLVLLNSELDSILTWQLACARQATGLASPLKLT